MARNFSSFSGSWIIESPKPFYSNWQRQRRIKVKVRESKFYVLNVLSGKWFVICDILKGKWGKSLGTISKLCQTRCGRNMVQPVADQSWAKKLFCCSQRQPINNVAFRFKEVLLSQPLNKTIIPISGCIAEGDMGVYGIAVLGFFSCGISVILILTCGIAVSSSSAVCGF